MTKLTRKTIQWNSGVMLGWNSSRKMDGIMRHPQYKQTLQKSEADYFPGTKINAESNEITSSFFPYSKTSTRGGETRKAGRLARPQTKQYHFQPEKDFSPDFLEYLQSLNKRDFEHAVAEEEDYLKNFLMNSTTVDKTTSISVEKPKSIPETLHKTGESINLVHGFQLFGSPTGAKPNARPSTVPKYLSRKEGGKSGDQNNRSGVIRPGRAAQPSPPAPSVVTTVHLTETYNNKVKALTKTKVTPSEVENECSLQSQKNSSSVAQQSPVESVSYSSSFTGSPSDSGRPSSSTSSSGYKRVTFAADVVNYERESKPSKKRKLAKRRRQGFPHPSRGIFLPPESEIVESTGPTGICKDNPYLIFNQVWTHPAARSSGESSASRVIRQERFHRIMNDLEHAHTLYNRLVSVEQNDFLIHSIFKRYILVLDLALTEGHLTQVEHLLDTISKSIPVLQQNIFYYVYGPQIINDMEQSQNQEKMEEEHPDLILTRYALSKISGPLPRQDSATMSIETVLVKMCLELIELVFSQYGSFEFRNALTTLPYTVKVAIAHLNELRTNKDNFCYLKWINNSAVQRDYRSVLKNLGLLDRYGCKADFPTSTSLSPTKADGFTSKSKSKSKRSSVQTINKRGKTPTQSSSQKIQSKSTIRPNSS